MNLQILPLGRSTGWGIGLVAALLLLGCVTPSSVVWDKRVGTYSWDDALAEFGPPDRVTNLTGGVKAAEWIESRTKATSLAPPPPSYTRGETLESSGTYYGRRAPDKILRLSFAPDGKLIDWYRNY